MSSPIKKDDEKDDELPEDLSEEWEAEDRTIEDRKPRLDETEEDKAGE